MTSAQVCLREAHQGLHLTGQMLILDGDGRCWPPVVMGVEDNKIMCVLLIPIWKSRDTVMGSWGPLWCRLSTGITSCCEDVSNKCLFLRCNCTCWSGRGFWTVQSTNEHQSVLLNQHVDMLHLSGGWIILCSPTDLNHCVLEIWQIFILETKSPILLQLIFKKMGAKHRNC